MTNASVAADFDQSLDIKSNISSEIAFYAAVVVNILSELGDIILGQISDSCIGIDTGCCENIVGSLTADAEDIGQADFDSFISG